METQRYRNKINKVIWNFLKPFPRKGMETSDRPLESGMVAILFLKPFPRKGMETIRGG